MKLETIKIGRIVNAHGTRGEVRVQPRDADPYFLTEFDTFLLDGKPVTPTACHVHKSLVLKKLPGVDTMDDALKLRDKVLYIRREDAELEEDEFFDDELLGLQVYNAESGDLLGELTAVDPYPAHKIYTVKGKKEYLIPAVKGAFIESIDMDANRMDVHVWEGLATDEH